ncbi:uncharacterized protein FHS85_004483 [Rhodoligotrophos appendicifer]|uniref:TM0106 family RecB-like putative nuclease n=1 Tax=Rhodoligotrophos appendicifer TaxID=987056 RepID=UPI0011849E31|nr:TM0106 family RecB-like putative nuclease [Rhodoligotrophos appendicifer]
MKNQNGHIILSPSDLVRFQACEHATELDLRFARGEDLEPDEDDANSALLQRKGHAHEASYLRDKAAGDVVEISRERGFEAAAIATREAMQAGAPNIYQGALSAGIWQGWSDFIERVDRPSALGDFSYEVVDTKLKRHASPAHALQLSIYSRGLAEIQGVQPDLAHVVLGTQKRVSIPLNEISSYAGRLSRRLEGFITSPWPTLPEPVGACGFCRWRSRCDDHYSATDSLVRVAGITGLQRRRLTGANIRTLADLAANITPVPRMHADTLAKLRSQARLQSARLCGGGPTFELKRLEPCRGFARLPLPSPGDIFFDMEGDPLVEGGLEYLFGLYWEIDGKGEFKSWWAHDAEAEQGAVIAVLNAFAERLTRYPDAFIYHYNHYEVTALKRLTQRYGVGEAVLDHLLRNHRFVDLYRVVGQSIYASELGYSLKDLEAFYLEKRTGEVANAGDSIVAYEQWLETGDAQILDDIKRYNEVDCRSTKGLRDWLLSIRPPHAQWFEHVLEGETEADEQDESRENLRASIGTARPHLGDDVADLLFELNFFHARSNKPGWWEYFDRQERDIAALVEDLESLGGLTAIGKPQGLERLYEYPQQETKLREGSTVEMRGDQRRITIESFDRARNRVRLAFPKSFDVLPDALDLIPSGPLPVKVIEAAIARVTNTMVKGDEAYRAIGDFLQRRQPRLAGRRSGAPILATTDTTAGTVAAIAALDDTCLVIQGPPGTGKTYVSAVAIVELAVAGKRVAVSSNAHKAIDNLLMAVAEHARRRGVTINIVKKVGSGDSGPEDPMVRSVTSNSATALKVANVVGGTAWYFARPEVDGKFDHVFIDEAGQVSIANTVAIAACARNLVLVGDQMQLPQPIQGIHPGESGLSALDYLLAGHHTVPPDRGIFLPVSRRMHPRICRIVSDLVYEGRLVSDEGAARHSLDAPGLPPAGILFEEIAHTGNAQSSKEEAARIEKLYARLLKARFTDREGVQRRLTTADILVVSPYNAQVNLLAETLPHGARVGTVDRFQGQEAPVCLISMATSSGDEIPRDIAFLFSLNRLNVAISRAQALSIIIASPRLLDVACGTLEEMRLVNALCALQDYATVHKHDKI